MAERRRVPLVRGDRRVPVVGNVLGGCRGAGLGFNPTSS